MCMVVSRKCKSEWIISWKLCKSKTEGIFGCNMGTHQEKPTRTHRPT